MADKKKKAPELTVGKDAFDAELDKVSKALEDMIEDLTGEQPRTAQEEDLVTTVYERLELFEQGNREAHEQAKICRQVLHMEDPEQDSIATVKRTGKRTLQLQTLKSTINNVVADQMLSMPEAKLMPETTQMQEQADDLQDIVHYVIYCANDFEHVHYRRCEDFYGPGTAVMQIAWDADMAYGRGDVALIRWPIESFVWDPMAENIQDCRAVMKTSWHPLSWFREHWPEAGKYVGGEENSYNNVGMTEGQEDAKQAGDDDRALLIEYWWRTYNAKTRRYTINVAMVAGHALLEVQTDVYAHGLYPFVIDVHDSKEGSLAGDGLVRELVPMMRYINRYAAYADLNARKSAHGRLLVSRQAGIDMDALADMDNEIIEGDKVDPTSMQWMQSQPFTPAILNLMTMFQSDLKADSGANQFTRGETTGGIVSGKAINSLIQAGGKVASMRTEQLKYGFKQMVEQILWLIAQFYDQDRIVMITGRNGKPNRSIQIDKKKLFGMDEGGAINPPPYTVQIEVSSRDPQRIANQNQMFMEAYTMSAQAQQFFPLSALFNILNLDGKDKILPVIKENEHFQEQMQQLQQQVEQMQAQMEQMQGENQNLKMANEEMANSMADMSARKGGSAPTIDANEPNPIVDNAANTLGLPTGAELPV